MLEPQSDGVVAGPCVTPGSLPAAASRKAPTMVLLVRHRLRPHAAPGRRPRDLRTGMRIAGWVTVGVVAVNTALTGLPRDHSGELTVLLLTTAALVAWLVSLAPRVQAPPVLVGCLVGTGLAGAWLSLLQPNGPGFLASFM